MYYMDEITKELQSFLVKLHYSPDSVSEKMEHYLEHLTHLLPPDDEESLLHYVQQLHLQMQMSQQS